MGELKPGWKRVKFGQLAECVNDRVDDPSSAGVERYVGLEHLDPESLTIRRWGTPDEVESTKLRFQPGDVIFGKRRAYQRKLAVADFDGICSAHAMVLRAKPNLVLPEFLPYFMQSDLFMERAVEISVGSLSPTINWRTLAEQEFVLPPLEEQRRLLPLLRSGQAAAEAAATGEQTARKLFASASWELTLGLRAPNPWDVGSTWSFGRPPTIRYLPRSWTVVPIASVARLESGHTPSRRVPGYWGGDIPWISLGDVSELNTRNKMSTCESITSLGEANSAARTLPVGTVVLSRTASVGRVTTMGRPMATSQDYVNFVCGSSIQPDFLYFYFRALKPYWEFIAEGGGVRTIYFPFFKSLQIPMPPLTVQADVCAALASIESATDDAVRHAKTAHGAFSRLVNFTLRASR
jgi:type I restriction enzyme S subunit